MTNKVNNHFVIFFLSSIIKGILAMPVFRGLALIFDAPLYTSDFSKLIRTPFHDFYHVLVLNRAQHTFFWLLLPNDFLMIHIYFLQSYGRYSTFLVVSLLQILIVTDLLFVICRT